MTAIDYQSLASRVVFGSGTLERAPAVAGELGMARAMVITTGSQAATAQRLMDLLGDAGALLYPRAVMHTPVEVTLGALKLARARRIDGLIALGGGSAIGLAKAIALRTDLPQIAIPTTYAGSEMTPVVGQTEAGAKTVQRSDKVLPEVVIYDVDLTLSLPVGVSAVSGFNAIAHGVEALYARRANALLSAVAEDCVRLMAHALPRIAAHPGDAAARAHALEGAWLGGWSLANGGSALHHRLCHLLGGGFGLPHAETHTVLIPHVLAYNAPAVPYAMERLRRALGVEDPAGELYDLAGSLGAPRSLAELGLSDEGPGAVLKTLLADPPWNPRALDLEPLADMLRRAWRGERPR